MYFCIITKVIYYNNNYSTLTICCQSITIILVMEMNKNFSCGNRIKELRIERGLTQERLALTAGITPAYLGLVERGQKNATVAIIESICDALNVSLADFFSVYSSVDTPKDIDLQILSNIKTLSAQEKEVLLSIIKNLMEFRDLGKSSTGEPEDVILLQNIE